MLYQKAEFWINNRYNNNYDMMVIFLKELRKKREEDNIPEEVVKEQKRMEKECTVFPENPEHPRVVEIEEEAGYIIARYIKDEDFRRVVKEHNFHWDYEERAWRRLLSFRTGTFKNYAAMICNALLLEGFGARIMDKEIIKAAVNGDFTPETKRWISWSPDKKRIAIEWEKNEEIYQKAKMLPRAYYSYGQIFVKSEFFNEIIDFAGCYGFSISPGASKRIEEENLVRSGWDDEKICNKLGMELDEVIRLKQITGLKEAFMNHEFSKSWEEFEQKLEKDV